MPRYVQDVFLTLRPMLITDPWFERMIVMCGAEMKHDFAHTLNMAYHENKILHWWYSHVNLTPEHAESIVQAANLPGGTTIREELLGMENGECTADPRCLLLKYPMGSGKTILQAGLVAEMVTLSKEKIARGQSPGHLPYPGHPAVFVFATIAERDAFYTLLHREVKWDSAINDTVSVFEDADVFCINDSLRFSRDLKKFAVEGCYVALVCLAGIIPTFTSRVSCASVQADLDTACSRVVAMEDASQIGTLMTNVLRARTPFRSRDLLVMPSMLFFSEFNATVDQLIHMLALDPSLDDIIMTWGRTARFVIFDGADLGDVAIRYAASFKGLSSTFLRWSYAPPRTQKTITVSNIGQFVAGLDSAIQSGLSPIVLTFDTVRDCNTAHKGLTTIYKIDESEIFKCTGLDTTDHKAKLADLPRLARSVRFILTSPVLERGVSDAITLPQFHGAFYRGNSVRGRSAVQSTARFRLSTDIKVCFATVPIVQNTSVGNQAAFLFNALSYCKLYDGGMSNPRHKPFHHVPWESGALNRRHQAGYRRPIGVPSISGGNYHLGHDFGTLIRINKEVHAYRPYYVCMCNVPTPEVQGPCDHCHAEFVRVNFEAECTKGNPYLNVAGMGPSWYDPKDGSGIMKLDRTPMPFNSEFPYISTLAGKHFKPTEHASILASMDNFKREFRFARTFVEAAECDGYGVIEPTDDPFTLTLEGRAFLDLLNESQCAATLRLAEIIERFEKNKEFGIEQRVLSYQRLMGMPAKTDLTDLKLLLEMSWPWNEKADKPDFFDELHRSLGLTSALTDTYLNRTLDFLGNRPIEYYRAVRPSDFNPIAMGVAYESWILMHLMGMIFKVTDTPANISDSFVLASLSGEVRWSLTPQEAKAKVSTKVGDDKTRVYDFLSTHGESIFVSTKGKSRLTPDPTVEELFDAAGAMMQATLGTRLERTKPRAARERASGRVDAAGKLSYKLPEVDFTVRLMVLYCRAVRDVNEGALSNAQIRSMLRTQIGRVEKDHWFCDILCGVDHPGETAGDVTFKRVPGVRLEQTAKLNAFAARVLTFLSDKPEASDSNSAKRALITAMWREARNEDPTDLQIEAAYNNIRAELNGNDSDDDLDLSTLRDWYEEDDEAEHQQQINLHARLRSRDQGRYLQRRGRRRPRSEFVDDEAGESD